MRIKSFIFFTLFLAINISGQSPLDSITFGNPDSEKSHQVVGSNSEIIKGAMGESARTLLPNDPKDWQGGIIAFSVKVDGNKTNYLTFRFWGSDKTVNRLILSCDGKQIGYRHLGDYDLVDVGSEAPFHSNRFFYVTMPFPETLTNGKDQITCQLQSTGRIWGYGTNFDQYQKPMTEPTRGIYKVYTHTQTQFLPPSDEKQGLAPKEYSIRRKPGAEVLDEVKERVNKTIESLQNNSKPLNQMQLVFLASAFHIKWTKAYEDKKTIEMIVKGLDQIFGQYRQNPKLVQLDPATPNPDWFGLGPAGQAISLLADQIVPYLDDNIDDNGRKISRREAWSEMLIASREWHRHRRRLYTNQSMIVDMNIYLANRGIAVVKTEKAEPEAVMRQYLYESVGLEPWSGSETPVVSGGNTREGVGNDYRQITPKGLTRELGYVGNYGEVLDWIGLIYDATRPKPDEPGDEKIKNQLEKIVKARSYFRYPAPDDEGFRAMRLETVVGWRDNHYPGEIAYSELDRWDGSAIFAASITLDKESVGHVQQMIADNQFFASVKHQLETTNLRATQGLLKVPDQFELLKNQPPSSFKLPMSPDQPDFVFSDETDGVVAIKNGDQILYASLYWRARNAVNFLARVHYIRPDYALNSTVKEEIQFESGGQFYTRPDWTNFGFGNGGIKYPIEIHSAIAGEKLPIAKIPGDVSFNPGDESVYAGKGDFYKLLFGNYLIAMNMSGNKKFNLDVPAEFIDSIDLVTKKKSRKTIELTPQTTVVLYRKEKNK